MNAITERIRVVIFGLLVIVVGLCSPKSCIELLIKAVEELQK